MIVLFDEVQFKLFISRINAENANVIVHKPINIFNIILSVPIAACLIIIRLKVSSNRSHKFFSLNCRYVLYLEKLKTR